MRFKFLALAITLIFAFPLLSFAQNAAAPVATPAPVADLAPKKTIAVLSERKAVDELIASSDVVMLDVDKAPADAITEPDQLIGKAPRRAINANQPIRPTDIKAFTVIKKGEMVTIELQTPNMDLSVSGKALDNGAMGDAIRVTNLSSNRTIFAKVTGPNAVKVESAQ